MNDRGRTPGELEATSELGLSGQLSRLADGIARLIGQHFALARLEIVEDARRMGKGAAGIAFFVPFLLLGYGFLCAALTAWLQNHLPLPWALAAVGGANVLLGAVGLLRAAQTLKSRTGMDDTVDELRRSADLLSKPVGLAVRNKGLK